MKVYFFTLKIKIKETILYIVMLLFNSKTICRLRLKKIEAMNVIVNLNDCNSHSILNINMIEHINI